MKNKLKVIVDEQQDAIKHLKEYCDTDNIDPHEKKRLCVTYNQQFVWKKLVEKTYSGKIH